MVSGDSEHFRLQGPFFNHFFHFNQLGDLQYAWEKFGITAVLHGDR